jgi:hypothetical protein
MAVRLPGKFIKEYPAPAATRQKRQEIFIYPVLFISSGYLLYAAARLNIMPVIIVSR